MCRKEKNMEYKFTKDNFEKEVMNSDVPVMIDFYADWCGPCQMMMPVVEKLAEEYDGRAKVGKIDSDAEEELSARFNVMSIPNIIFIKNGEVVDRSVGAVPQKVLEDKLDRLL
jgi:thioredoxin 1